MALAIYRKEYPKKKQRLNIYIPFIMISGGLVLLFWVSWPIMSFKLITQNLFSNTISPIVNTETDLTTSVMAAGREESITEIADYTNPNVWYPQKPQKDTGILTKSYKLSIPTLGINNANVIIGGNSLEKSLIHYGGTALPGDYGTTVIFGHSTLTSFFDPKDYKTIFATLPQLKKTEKNKPGDEIYITYEGITYKYMIYDMIITKPTDLTPLEQKFDSSYLTLITCVPPGTYWERLNVKAKLVPL